jgi:hypothetical protein
MSAVWPALIGAIIGGALALTGAFAVELRRDRRRQLGATRIILSQLRRSSVELEALTEDAPASSTSSWLEGPHHSIRTSAWDEHAANFVGHLDEPEFEIVDSTHHRLAQGAEWGFTYTEGKRLIEKIAEAGAVVGRFAKPTWFDRHVWRL